jgi:hypothetical protein
VRASVGLALFLASAGAVAAPRLDTVTVQVLGGNDVVISVSIERPTLLDLNCDAVIDPGDGGRIPVSWGMGDGRTKTARYEFKQAGSYRVRVAGTGKDACVGLKEASVTVGAPRAAKGGAAPRCPSGWVLVDESVKGARYTCRPRPPAQALRCPEGTSYFFERGEIGCR